MSSKRKAEEISEDDDGHWSVGPTDNFSDWKVVVVDTESGKETPYHVHRKDLACGVRKSEYFSGVFHSEGLEESKSSVTRLELDNKMAEAFPVMLSYLYTGSLACMSKHIVPLFWLADYFIIESMNAPLKKAMQDKMQEDGVDGIVTLYKDAVTLDLRETLDAIVHHMEYATKYTLKDITPFLKVMSLDFFLRLQPLQRTSTRRRFWFLTVCEYISFHKAEIDDDFVCKLFNKQPCQSSLNIDAIAKLVDLLIDCPMVECIPERLQKRLFNSLMGYCSRVVTDSDISDSDMYVSDSDDSLPIKLPYIWKGLRIAQKIPNVDKKVLSTLQTSLDEFFTGGLERPDIFKNLEEDKLSLLHAFLSGGAFFKLCVVMQKKNTELNRELRKFHRFDDARNNQNKIRRYYSHRESGARHNPELRPKFLEFLPKWRNNTEEGWVFVDDDGEPLPLYTYRY